jgi:hypothetical protein
MPPALWLYFSDRHLCFLTWPASEHNLPTYASNIAGITGLSNFIQACHWTFLKLLLIGDHTWQHTLNIPTTQEAQIGGSWFKASPV